MKYESFNTNFRNLQWGSNVNLTLFNTQQLRVLFNGILANRKAAQTTASFNAT